MEKELNIAAILKDKPNTRIYDLLHNIYVKLYNVSTTDKETVVWCRYSTPKSNILFAYSELGTERGWLDGLQILKPSKGMQEWSKFAWKKGDVLCSNTGDSCIFVKWIRDDYTSFLGYYSTHNDYEKEECQTAVWSKETSKEDIWQYILAIEAVKNGTLNLETLQIEQPKQEFKDGDIVINEEGNRIYLLEEWDSIMDRIYYHACLDPHSSIGLDCSSGSHHLEYPVIRIATDSEKQLLFSALKKRGKVWDAEKKMLVDLPKKCEFEPMDWCLMRDLGDRRWGLCQFGFYISKEESEEGVDYYPYCAVGGNWYNECIPYNDQTAHLLGTTNEWKGGER